MFDGLSVQVAGRTMMVAEPKARYRAYYDEDGDLAITLKAEQRVGAQNAAALERVFALVDQLRHHLDGSPQALDAWLELEEALHDYWLEVAAAHYDLGVASGQQRPVLYATRKLAPRKRAEALARALGELAEALPDDDDPASAG